MFSFFFHLYSNVDTYYILTPTLPQRIGFKRKSQIPEGDFSRVFAFFFGKIVLEKKVFVYFLLFFYCYVKSERTVWLQPTVKDHLHYLKMLQHKCHFYGEIFWAKDWKRFLKDSPFFHMNKYFNSLMVGLWLRWVHKFPCM